jgi:hypothetical protein
MLSLKTERNLFSIFGVALVLLGGGLGLMYASRNRPVPQGFLFGAYAALAIGGVLMMYAILLTATLAFSPSRAHARLEKRARILARYLEGENRTILVNEMPSDLGEKMLIKVEFDDGDIGDYECDRSIYEQAELGKRGVVVVQGDRVAAWQADPETDV